MPAPQRDGRAIAGHATAAFTTDQYVTVLDEMAEPAAAATAAFVPRKGTVRVINESARDEDDH